MRPLPGAPAWSPATPPRPARTVLVVEDDADVSTLVSEVLRDEGYHVARAHSGEAALSVLRSMNVHLLLLDLGLPGGVGGADVWRGLSELERPPAVVVVSGADTLPPALMLAGVTQLKKPFDLDVLLDVVATRLQG